MLLQYHSSYSFQSTDDEVRPGTSNTSSSGFISSRKVYNSQSRIDNLLVPTQKYSPASPQSPHTSEVSDLNTRRVEKSISDYTKEESQSHGSSIISPPAQNVDRALSEKWSQEEEDTLGMMPKRFKRDPDPSLDDFSDEDLLVDESIYGVLNSSSGAAENSRINEEGRSKPLASDSSRINPGDISKTNATDKKHKNLTTSPLVPKTVNRAGSSTQRGVIFDNDSPEEESSPSHNTQQDKYERILQENKKKLQDSGWIDSRKTKKKGKKNVLSRI